MTDLVPHSVQETIDFRLRDLPIRITASKIKCLNNFSALIQVLMDDTVPAFFGAPMVVRTGLMSRFTAIAVDAQVKTTEGGKAYDVIFIGESV